MLPTWWLSNRLSDRRSWTRCRSIITRWSNIMVTLMRYHNNSNFSQSLINKWSVITPIKQISLIWELNLKWGFSKTSLIDLDKTQGLKVALKVEQDKKIWIFTQEATIPEDLNLLLPEKIPSQIWGMARSSDLTQPRRKVWITWTRVWEMELTRAWEMETKTFSNSLN